MKPPSLIATLRGLLHSPGGAQDERCDLCGGHLADPHTHVADIGRRRLLCACGSCATLESTGGTRQLTSAPAARPLRSVPRRFAHSPSMMISAASWQSLEIPVDVAFFFINSSLARTVAFYPGPAGATESLLSLDAWAALADQCPWMKTLAPDVEGLLARKMGDDYRCFVVPIDTCYELVGRIRTHWVGLGGGEVVRKEIDGFFEAVRVRAGGLTSPELLSHGTGCGLVPPRSVDMPLEQS